MDDGTNETVVESLTITVVDVDDEAPSGLRLLNDGGDEIQTIVAREIRKALLGTLRAEDLDTSISELSYEANDNRFTIEETGANTGIYVLKSTTLLDYEGTNIVNETVILEVTMNDGANNTAIESLTIRVADIDDEMPTGLGLVLPLAINEGAGRIVGTLTAQDVDTPVEGLIYTTGDSRFIIEEMVSNSIVYKVLKSTDLLDYEDRDKVSVDGTTVVEVTVSDGARSVVVESLVVSVIDIDDEFPTDFRLLEIDTIVVEGSTEILGTLTANDIDTASGDLVYSIGDNRFEVEETSHGSGIYILRATMLLDYEGIEVIGGTTITQLTVSDRGDNRTIEELVVTVTDVDDEFPTNLRLLDDIGNVMDDIEVAEGDIEILGTLAADDADTDIMDLEYRTSDNRFTIEETSDGSNIYVLKSTILLDYDDMFRVSNDGITTVEITVNDGIATHNYISLLNISLEDVNDNIPELTVEDLVSTAIEETLTGGTVIGRVVVNDADRTEVHKTIEYGSSNNNFSIEGTTGEIFFTPFEISGDDFEVSTTITASDGKGSDTVEVRVTIDNTDNSQGAKISDQLFIVLENVRELPYSVLATSGNAISYNVAADADFNIGSSTGILSFKEIPDYEDVSDREYSVIVTVMSSGSESSALITIKVEDENDNAPTSIRLEDNLGMELLDVELEEGSIEVLGRLVAEDRDTVGELRYTIEDNRFTIERDRGSNVYVLESTRFLDYEDGLKVMGETTAVEVTVNDGNPSHDYVETFYIRVIDLDDEAPIGLGLFITGDDGGLIELENIELEEEEEIILGTLIGDDEDTASEDLVYTIDDDRFMIEEVGSGTGIYVLKSTELLDYESGEIVNETTIVQVTVNDGMNMAIVESLTIRVLDKDTVIDERISVEDHFFSSLDAGDGFDVLIFNGIFDLDLTEADDNLLRNIEEIDMTGIEDSTDPLRTVNNRLLLDLDELKAIGVREFYITGDDGDKLIVLGIWDAVRAEERGGKVYHIYEQEEGGETYQLFIDSEIETVASFNERIVIRDTDFDEIDGRAGFDVLVIDGMGIDLDLTMIEDDLLNNIEGIDLTGTGDNSLTLNALELQALGGFVEGGKTKLVIEGDVGDSIIVEGGTWKISDVDYGGSTYILVEQGEYQLIVNSAISVDIPANIDLSSELVGSGIGFKLKRDNTSIGHVKVSQAGDINGDGYDDVIVGLPTSEGLSYVIFGRSSGFEDIDLGNLAEESGFKITGEDAGDESGISVSGAGDINSDGYADLIVGAHLAEEEGKVGLMEVSVM